jgi:hypothetical protein
MSDFAAFLSWRSLMQAPRIGLKGDNDVKSFVVPDSLLAKEATDLLGWAFHDSE